MGSRTGSVCLLLGLAACSSGGDDDAVVGGAVSVTAATPGVVQGGDTAVPWTVTGTGFEAGATVTVNTAGVTVAAVTVVSPTQITFDLTAPNTVIAGTTSVTVTNPDMTSGASVVPTIPETVLLSTSIQPVLTTNCTGCHSGVAPSGGLDLSAGTTHGATVNVNSTQAPALAQVVPGDPDASYLVDKIEGTQTVGARMPLNAAPLTATEMALVRAWISAGALNN